MASPRNQDLRERLVHQCGGPVQLVSVRQDAHMFELIRRSRRA